MDKFAIHNVSPWKKTFTYPKGKRQTGKNTGNVYHRHRNNFLNILKSFTYQYEKKEFYSKVSNRHGRKNTNNF